MPESAPQPSPQPLHRHPSLRPLSREHMSGLIRARELRRAAAADQPTCARAVVRFLAAWRSEIRAHFDDEERLLLPLTDDPAMRERLLADHTAIRSLAARCEADPGAAAGDPALLQLLGTLLHDHIRWEERVYFEAVQRDHPDALATLHEEADRIEDARPGSRARCRVEPLLPPREPREPEP